MKIFPWRIICALSCISLSTQAVEVVIKTDEQKKDDTKEETKEEEKEEEKPEAPKPAKFNVVADNIGGSDFRILVAIRSKSGNEMAVGGVIPEHHSMVLGTLYDEEPDATAVAYQTGLELLLADQSYKVGKCTIVPKEGKKASEEEKEEGAPEEKAKEDGGDKDKKEEEEAKSSDQADKDKKEDKEAKSSDQAPKGDDQSEEGEAAKGTIWVSINDDPKPSCHVFYDPFQKEEKPKEEEPK